MVTFVGTQEKFADALNKLAQLDRAAAEAYEAAIKGLTNQEYKNKLTEFRQDHERHIEEISTLLKNNNEKVSPDGDMAKELIAKGKVIAADFVAGDDMILRAMQSNEKDTKTAYERMNERKDMLAGAKEIIQRGLQDEKKHAEWLENTLQAASS